MRPGKIEFDTSDLDEGRRHLFGNKNSFISLLTKWTVEVPNDDTVDLIFFHE